MCGGGKGLPVIPLLTTCNLETSNLYRYGQREKYKYHFTKVLQPKITMELHFFSGAQEKLQLRNLQCLKKFWLFFGSGKGSIFQPLV